MKKRKDKYDRAIEYLTKHPEKIVPAWFVRDYKSKSVKSAHTLFQICGDEDTDCIGCLTQIRANARYVAATRKLTKEIRADNRIPARPELIEVSDLPVFAEWQRRLDKELNRK